MMWLRVCCLLLGSIAEGLMEGPPYWQNQLPDHITLRGSFSEVRLDCDADGIPAPSVEWMKNGNTIQIEQNEELQVLNNGSLVLTKVDEASYTCVIKNKHGQLTRTYTIDLFPDPPIIVRPPRNVTVEVGRTARFECHYTSDLSADMKWLKGNKLNSSYVDGDHNPHPDVIKTADPEVLVLENVTEEDESWYTCLVSNKVGISHKSAWLTVNQASKGWNTGASFSVLTLLWTVFACVSPSACPFS